MGSNALEIWRRKKNMSDILQRKKKSDSREWACLRVFISHIIFTVIKVYNINAACRELTQEPTQLKGTLQTREVYFYIKSNQSSTIDQNERFIWQTFHAINSSSLLAFQFKTKYIWAITLASYRKYLTT